MAMKVDMMVDGVINLIGKIDYANFFDFLGDFVSALSKVLVESHIVPIFQALIENVHNQQTNKIQGLNFSNFVIDRCVGIIRKITRTKDYMKVHH